MNYNKSYGIWHLWNHMDAEYCNFLVIRTVYVICTLLYIAVSWTGLTI